MIKRLTRDEGKRRGLDFADLVGFDAGNALFGGDIRGQMDGGLSASGPHPGRRDSYGKGCER
jgi:hypothetical protein